MDDLRIQIQQLQEPLEHYEAIKHGDVHDDVEHGDVEDPSQGFVDWDSLPTYDIDINDEDLVGGSLSFDQEKESIVDWVSLLIYNIYSKKDEPLEKVNLLDNIENFVGKSSTHHVLDEIPKSEVFNLDVNKVDFLGVANILSNSFDVNAFDDFYAEKNFVFKSEEIVDPFWKILMAHKRAGRRCVTIVWSKSSLNLEWKVFKLIIAVLWWSVKNYFLWGVTLFCFWREMDVMDWLGIWRIGARIIGIRGWILSNPMKMMQASWHGNTQQEWFNKGPCFSPIKSTSSTECKCPNWRNHDVV